MDIIDIMLAKAMTPQGQTESYVSIANAAAVKAEKAKSDAEEAVATVEAAADEIATAKSEASDLLSDAREALETAQAAQINMPEAYSTTGQNTDGYMTQKATTDALALKADVSALAAKADASALAGKMDVFNLNDYASKTYVIQQIAANPASGGSGGGTTINLNPEDAGYLTMIDENGQLVPSSLDEIGVIEALLQTGAYTLKSIVGLDMDYTNKTMTRIQNATNLTAGQDFDQYTMYGGRMRCNVADDGTINAFYGDNDYRDNGSNGQVMVYQPKFYYQRTILDTSNLSSGQAIRHERLFISQKKQPGFKLAPIFDDGNGGELDYVLFSAYEGAVSEGKLTSIANNKPIGNLTIIEAEQKAALRGTGWHISSMAAESANQMLEIVEFGSMNGQVAFEDGICNISEVAGVNCSSITGSTASLGNTTGHASSTTNEINGTTTLETEAGKRAISYRGMENPWGNMWHMLGDMNVKGDGQSQGGAPYVCQDFNYTPGTIGDNYEAIGFNLPATYGWVSAMGYGNSKYDWIFLPAECSNVANSLLPIGDNLWVTGHTNENKILAVGGSYNLQENVGPFYYAADRNVQDSSRSNYGARLMFIPTKNEIYTANIAKWTTKMEG